MSSVWAARLPNPTNNTDPTCLISKDCIVGLVIDDGFYVTYEAAEIGLAALPGESLATMGAESAVGVGSILIAGAVVLVAGIITLFNC